MPDRARKNYRQVRARQRCCQPQMRGGSRARRVTLNAPFPTFDISPSSFFIS